MSSKLDFNRFVRSLQICGLYPTISLNKWCRDAPVIAAKTRPAFRHFIYPITMCVLAWLNFLRELLLFYFVPHQISGYAAMLASYFLMCATIRTSFIFISWRGDRWVGIFELLNIEHVLMANKPAAPNKTWDSFWQEERALFTKKRSHLYMGIHICCWFFIIFNNFILTWVAVARKDVFGPMVEPFESTVPAGQNDHAYNAHVALGTFLGFASDSAAGLVTGFICCLTIEFASRFWHMKNYIVETYHKPGVACGLVEDIEGDQATKTIISKALKRPPVLEVECIRRAHLFFSNAVRALDQVARVCVGSTISFGFFGLLFNVYQMGWGTGDGLMEVALAFWCLGCFVFLMSYPFASAYLNRKATAVRDALFQVPTQSLFEESNAPSGIRLLVLVGQCGSQCIALTFYNIISLRYETIMALFGAVATYFLILLDYAAGERRGNTQLTHVGAATTVAHLVAPVAATTHRTAVIATTKAAPIKNINNYNYNTDEGSLYPSSYNHKFGKQG